MPLKTFHQKANFAKATINDQTSDFTSASAGPTAVPYSQNGLTISGSPEFIYADTAYNSIGQYLGTAPDSSVQTTVDVPEGTTAIGFDLGTFAASTTVDVAVNGVDVTNFSTSGPPASTFIGFTDMTPITNVTFTSTAPELDVLDYVLGSRGETTIIGTPGPDYLSGGLEDEVIFGLPGADTITGGGGNDIIYGGQGNDLITYGSTVDGGAQGSSLVEGERGSDGIRSLGSFGSNTISGGRGDDAVDASLDQGRDLILGGAGDDTILPGSGANTVRGGLGDDRILVTAAGNDLLFGGNGNDVIDFSGVMSAGQSGGAPSETVYGGSGDDTIDAGGSLTTATMTGGLGNDTFIFSPNADGTANAGAGSGLDVVTDFVSGLDKFAISARNDTTSVTPASGQTTSVQGAGAAYVTPRNFRNYGTTVPGATLFDAASSALSGVDQTSSIPGASAATFKFGSDFYVAFEPSEGVRYGGTTFDPSRDILIDIKSTSSLSRGDFVE